jgi:Leucine-rich repeat (LRR) protein
VERANPRLTGSIPAAIGNLTALEIFSLDFNELSGTIPESIGNLTKLKVLGLQENSLSGPIPATLANLVELEDVYLSSNNLIGPIPAGIGNLTKLRELWMSYNNLSGDLPSGLGALRNLERLILSSNSLTGTIPPGLFEAVNLTWLQLENNAISGTIPALGKMKGLEDLRLYNNRLTGSIPADIVTLPNLRLVLLSNNRLTGSLPAGIGAMRELDTLMLQGNQLGGTLPPDVAGLRKLRYLYLGANQFSGTIPASWFDLPLLEDLMLSSNLLSGTIPSEIGRATNLAYLNLARNGMRGEVPSSITALTSAQFLDLGENALTASPSVAAFLESRSQFAKSQTIAPTAVTVEAVSSTTVSLAWDPIPYNYHPGGYQLLVSTTAGGPYTPLLTTPDKNISAATITGLSPQTRYFIVIKTVTFPHGGGLSHQLNTLFSDSSVEVSATTSAPSATPASVLVTSQPRGLVQSPGQSGATDSYTLTNVGGTPAVITLTQSGSFFTQSPTSFSIAPGANQIVSIVASAAAEGEHSGRSMISGDGVEAGTTVEIKLLVAQRAAGGERVTALSNRLDLVAPEGTNPSGSVAFRNDGTSEFIGVLVSDVEFLVPQAGIVTIAPSATVNLTVTADRSKRPDAELLNGTQIGRVSLISLSEEAAKLTPFDTSATAGLTTVLDTVAPRTSASSIPPLSPNEIALFVPAVGHVRGSVGEFLSDVAIINAHGIDAVSDVRLYYLPVGSTASTTAELNAIASGQTVALADVVKSVFGSDAQIGTLQIRSSRAATLQASANIFNASNPLGNFGTSIPVFRSDRAATLDRPIVLTGLRKDGAGHTNLYVQETAGSPATARIDFFDVDGRELGNRSVQVAPFGLTTVVDPLVPGSVAARVTLLSGDGIVAYATPVDRASGDTWAVADWSQLHGFDSAEAVIIPIAGTVRGANDTYFRTDVAITNRCSGIAALPGSGGGDATDPCTGRVGAGVLRFYPTSGGVHEKNVELALMSSSVWTDVVRSAFGIESDVVGHLVFTPVSGAYSVTSRTYTVVSGSGGTFGSAVPALGGSLAIRSGQSRRIGGLDDSTRRTVAARTGATRRTNFGLLETRGEAARVRLSLFFNDPRSLAFGQPIASKEYDLAPRQLLNVSNLVEAIVGPDRETLYGDLRNVQLRVQLISSTGGVMVYTSSVDNGTGDSILRAE